MRWVRNGRRMSRQSAFQSVHRFSSPLIVTVFVCFLMRFGASKRTVPSPMDFTSSSGSVLFSFRTMSPSLCPTIRYLGSSMGTSPYWRNLRFAPHSAHAFGAVAYHWSLPRAQSPWPHARQRNRPPSRPRSQIQFCHLSWYPWPWEKMTSSWNPCCSFGISQPMSL